MNKNYEWLPHVYDSLTNETYGYTVTPFSIALEGWRRGLKLTFLYTKETESNASFILTDGEIAHCFSSSRGDLVSRKAIDICKNKFETKKYLKEAKVPVPEGQDFAPNILDHEIIDYANKVGYPLVIKPLDGTGGKGVITNIKNEEEFKKDLKYIRDDLGYKHVIVESYFKGEDYRVYVVGEKVVAVTKRFPPNIIGDGKSTIKTLIMEKNNLKKKMKIYRNSLIKIDKELKNFLAYNNLSLETVPAKNERIFVKSKNNVSVGGDPVDATDELPPKAKSIAVKALNAIPDLPQGGVDVMVNHETGNIIVLEINSRPNIRLNLFPMEGKGRDIPKAIIDYYFPNTKQNISSPLYFDYGEMWKKIKKDKVDKFHIPNHPSAKMSITRFIVSGQVRNVNYGKWIKEIAEKNNLHGYVKHLDSGKLSIVVAGKEQDVKMFTHIINEGQPKQFSMFEIEELKRKSPVMLGFFIENIELDQDFVQGYYPVRLEDPKKGSKSVSKKVSRTQKEKKLKKATAVVKKNKKETSTINYEKEYYKLINSTSWKITKPIRKIKAKLKKN